MVSASVEMNEADDVIQAVYKYALDAAGIQAPFEWIKGRNPGILAKKLEFARGAVYCFVSESGWDEEVEIRDKALGRNYAFTLPEDRSFLFAIDRNGNVLEVYRNCSVVCR
jgi:hypothetical protein